MQKSKATELISAEMQGEYAKAVQDITTLLETARRQAARSVNALMTATYWQIGRRIVEFEQGGKERAGYGEKLIERLSADLTAKLGRGFSQRNLEQMRQFYTLWQIPQTVSAESGTENSDNLIVQTLSGQLEVETLAPKFPPSWSHYVKLLSVENPNARAFYEAESLRGGWSLRQLERQINSLFYERTALSRDKAAMLIKGATAKPEDRMSIEAEIKDPFVLEFLNLKDEYSETEIEEALINTWRVFCWNWVTISRLSPVKRRCASAIPGFAWICCCTIGGCAAWSSLI